MGYVRENLQDTYGILDLQEKLLEIMVDIDLFCGKYSIDYCLMAGSALGAERHKGFIPWDDDIDIYMTEQGYADFRTAFGKYGNKEKYYLQEWGKSEVDGKTMITMAKVRLNHSQINEATYHDWNTHKGIFVDIFILHNCPSDKRLQRKQYLWTEAVVLKGLEMRGYKAKGAMDSVVIGISKLIPRKWILRRGLQEAYKYQNIDTEFTHGFVDTRKFSRAVFPKHVIFPGKYTEFENVKLKVPNNNAQYLRIQFGPDYMTPPPESMRPINKHTTEWKEDKNIVYSDLSDEKKLV